MMNSVDKQAELNTAVKNAMNEAVAQEIASSSKHYRGITMDKVSSPFYLPVTARGDCLFDHNNEHCVAVEFDGPHKAKAAALAINAYPAMLAALEDIAECTRVMHEKGVDTDGGTARLIRRINKQAQQALAAAKGEA